MNEIGAKPPPPPPPSLVVAEKKPHHRPSGCVGIFFKLFDWNRRFANKKLFPKKLLPPARANQVSKKFIADEKLPMPKQKLIADSKSDGFPTTMKDASGCSQVNSERHNEITAPGLVARLMGLDTMPVLESKKKPSNGSSYSGNRHSDENAGNLAVAPGGGSASEKEDSHLDKKHEFHPQKIQKTGLCERRPLNTRLGAVEAFQIRNILSRSRKRQPKLASPVKSPRTAKNTSRLMDAAARILEPGIQQARTRAKCALSYHHPNSTIYPAIDVVMREADVVVDFPADSSFDTGVHYQGSRAQTSCINCGHLLDSMIMNCDATEQAPVLATPTSNFPNSLSQRAEGNHNRMDLFSENDDEVVLLRSRLDPVMNHHRETINNTTHHAQNDQSHWAFPNNNSSSTIRRREASSSTGFKHCRAPSHSQMILREDSVQPSRSCFTNTHNRRLSTNSANNMALNRNVSLSRVRGPRNAEQRFKGQAHGCAAKDESSSPQSNLARKRNAPGYRRLDSSTSSSKTDGQRSIKSRVTASNRQRCGSTSSRPISIKGKSGLCGDNVASGSGRDVGVVPYSFSSFKARTLSGEGSDVMARGRSDLISDGTSTLKLVKEEFCGEKSSMTSSMIDRDILGTLLQDKLKELACQADNESAHGMAAQGKTTASILHDLISALTAKWPVTCDEVSAPGIINNLSSEAASKDRSSQGKTRPERSSLRFSGNHFSPGSVLDASFSNDSCVSSSIDESPGHMVQSESMDLSSDEPELLNNDVDLSDSASSIINGGSRCNIIVVADLFDYISSALQRITDFSNVKSASCLFGYHAKGVLLNMELLFGNTSQSERFVDFLLGTFLDKLETLAIAAWSSTVILGFETVTKGENRSLRSFLFDCLVESLSIRYERYLSCGFRAWYNKIPTRMSLEILLQVFDNEVRKWAGLAGRVPDEIIDWEMSSSLGKWTDFEIEEFETGVDIGQEIFQNLVDEIFADLMQL